MVTRHPAVTLSTMPVTFLVSTQNMCVTSEPPVGGGWSTTRSKCVRRASCPRCTAPSGPRTYLYAGNAISLTLRSQETALGGLALRHRRGPQVFKYDDQASAYMRRRICWEAMSLFLAFQAIIYNIA
ncbi:hypothetical protein L226DRAFT_259861 [Lentinus tigrinus ALCF2SS1-7]|uniref:uncharacterized protein n=1 Tax=Lentinus tigrinus ALCF2SS1-7 TaxID=1328758 RepID=UPI001165EEC6|nr:hypothetical protein L226DRAFT_259861 [Lentinus tigrinus ALCF2SS1-7]